MLHFQDLRKIESAHQYCYSEDTDYPGIGAVANRTYR